jgi:hypothetical protein
MNGGSQQAAFDIALAICVVSRCYDVAVGAQAQGVGGACRDHDNISPVTHVALPVAVGPDAETLASALTPTVW